MRLFKLSVQDLNWAKSLKKGPQVYTPKETWSHDPVHHWLIIICTLVLSCKDVLIKLCENSTLVVSLPHLSLPPPSPHCYPFLLSAWDDWGNFHFFQVHCFNCLIVRLRETSVSLNILFLLGLLFIFPTCCFSVSMLSWNMSMLE